MGGLGRVCLKIEFGFIIDGLNIDVREINPLCGNAVLCIGFD